MLSAIVAYVAVKFDDRRVLLAWILSMLLDARMILAAIKGFFP